MCALNLCPGVWMDVWIIVKVCGSEIRGVRARQYELVLMHNVFCLSFQGARPLSCFGTFLVLCTLYVLEGDWTHCSFLSIDV
jgi:hypothetical protein